jgi:protein-S-isoprenylcysteine O-methyltransferase Ste14
MNEYGYGLWALVIVNSAIFILFALSFFHPASRRDWKAMGAFSAFVVALFTEMYGVPLTIWLLAGAFGDRFDLTHDGGHLWSSLLGWDGDPHLSPFHLASYVFIGGGFWLIATAWRVLWEAARRNTLATTGAYRYVRHPQYAGFLAVMVGFLLQWPTLPTLVLFPILVAVYRRLAIAEEQAVRDAFGEAWDAYAAATPRFIPRRKSQTERRPPGREHEQVEPPSRPPTVGATR